ncbi:MAG TPA: SurA N-terminal domain-containing protein [Alphaproteobacteria bacterium]|nr:SurA N-terminal domain-containing protein [Alphaproteobacteria bacterium]
MLEYLRDMSNKPIAKVLIGILMFSFVGWGVAEWVLNNANRESALLRVGDIKITPGQFSNEKTRELERLSKPQQKQIYTDPAASSAFLNKVMGDLTNSALIQNRANDLKFIVTDRRIAREIRNFPEFQDRGTFSPMKFDRILNNSGFSEEQFAEYLRSQILRGMVLGSMSVPVKVPDFEVKAVYNTRYGQRQIDYTAVNFGDFKVANPTDSQLREFYKQNPKMIPESRVVSYVLVSAQMDKPDSYDAGYTRAQKMEDSIISGDSMSVAAKKVNAKYILLPAFQKNKRPVDQLLTDQVVAKIFAMEQGLESEIMETKQGFAIIRVEKINKEAAANFDSVKSNLIAGWKTEEQKKQAYLHANQLLINLNKDKSLAGKKSVTVSRANGAPVELLVSAFSNGEGKNLIVPGKNSFWVLHVGKSIAPKMDNAKFAALKKELQGMKSRSVMSDYNSFLIREYPVKLNQKAFDKYFGNKQQQQ